MASEKKTRGSFVRKLRSKYRLVISNAETFQEVWGMRLSRMNLMVAVGGFFLLVLLLSWVVIFFTPVRELLPGNSSQAITQQVVGNALRADSLEREVTLWNTYLANLRVILRGGTPEISVEKPDSVVNTRGAEYTRSGEDSLLRAQVEQDFLLMGSSGTSSAASGKPWGRLVPPVQGQVSGAYSKGSGHQGTDIVTAADATINCVADGTVLLASWNQETGFSIMVQHPSGLVSIYKHCKRLLKKNYESVKAGDALGIVGNTGEQTTGPHLHLELWYQGTSINPEDYIAFGK